MHPESPAAITDRGQPTVATADWRFALPEAHRGAHAEWHRAADSGGSSEHSN